MPEEIVVRHCSPTLAGLKTGSLFSCCYASEEEMRADVRLWNQMLVPKGLRVLPLRYQEGRALIYIYRPCRLDGDLADPMAAGLLTDRGYPCGNADQCIVRLIEKLKEQAEFPHEIGLFLGYPPVDVLGFIQNRAQRCKCVGDWKVYGDERKARKLFNQYRKCTAVYCDLLKKGKSVEQLTVPTRS